MRWFDTIVVVETAAAAAVVATNGSMDGAI